MRAARQSALFVLPPVSGAFAAVLVMCFMLDPIARRVAPSASSHKGSKCIAASAGASELVGLCCASANAAEAEDGFAIACSLLLGSLPSAKETTRRIATSITEQISQAMKILDSPALELCLSIGENSFTDRGFASFWARLSQV